MWWGEERMTRSTFIHNHLPPPHVSLSRGEETMTLLLIYSWVLIRLLSSNSRRVTLSSTPRLISFQISFLIIRCDIFENSSNDYVFGCLLVRNAIRVVWHEMEMEKRKTRVLVMFSVYFLRKFLNVKKAILSELKWGVISEVFSPKRWLIIRPLFPFSSAITFVTGSKLHKT